MNKTSEGAIKMDGSPDLTKENLLRALQGELLESRMDMKFRNEVVQIYLRHKGFIWEVLIQLIPKSHRAMTISQVIAYLEQVCEKKAA